jgi:hypothetical protein
MLAFILVAMAASYTVGDLVQASQRGMSAESIDTMLGTVDLVGLSRQDMVTLLRAGVAPDQIRKLTENGRPTHDELLDAVTAGPLPRQEPPAREYVGLTDSAWLRLVGTDVSVRTDDGTVQGRLTGVHRHTVTIDGVEVELAAVYGVRRMDGAPILTLAESIDEGEEDDIDYGLPRPRASTLKRTGTTLMWSGAATAVAGAIGLGASVALTQDAIDDAATGDTSAGARATQGALLAGLSAVTLGSGGLMFIGGTVCVTIDIQRQRGRESREEPNVDDLPD